MTNKRKGNKFRMKALVFGEIIWDVYPEEQVIGGAPFNFSAHLAHLGNETYLVSAVGEDELGEQALAMAEKHGVRTDYIQKNNNPTGACIVTLSSEGIPCYNVLRDTAYDNIAANAELIKKIKELSPDVFYFNTLIQRSGKSKASLMKILEECSFPEIFCDINIRKDCFDRESVSLCMEKSTVVKISDEEAHYLYDMGLIENTDAAFPYAVAERYPNLRLVVYTLGKNGSEVLDTRSGKRFESGRPAAVKVVSTVGAGDCFGATFISEYIAGKSVPDAIRSATERSNIVVSHTEAVPF